jgi:hypothetical protein
MAIFGKYRIAGRELGVAGGQNAIPFTVQE